MQFSQKIEVRQSQSLVMTPQLQQAIKLLQMSNLDLTEYLQNELNSNPLLEEKIDEITLSKTDSRLDNAPISEENMGKIDTVPDNNIMENSFHDSKQDQGQDQGKYDEYRDSLSSLKHKNFAGGAHQVIADDRNNAFAQEVTLRDHLSSQLHISTQNPVYAMVGSYLIGSLSESGYLIDSPAEIATTLMLPEDIILKTLSICQSFDPVGCFALNLKNCLSLQLKEKDLFTEKMAILIDNLELLAKKEFKILLKKIDVPKEDLIQMIADIKQLNPKPGGGFSKPTAQSLIPDILIEEKKGGGWKLELNPATLPNLYLNKNYEKHLGKDGEETDFFLKESKSKAQWLLKSLDQRADTILRVSSEILRQQDGFFAYGISHLKPMNLKKVAEELELHESTISRVTAGKYMRCPKGTFELKFFFMSGISDADGEASISSEHVKNEVKKMIASETEKNILSDEDIVANLKQKDIHIARRTVAKYRDVLKIPSSVQRRREKKSL